MEDAALVGVGQPVGHPGHQPEDRRDVAHPAEALDLGRSGPIQHLAARPCHSPGGRFDLRSSRSGPCVGRPRESLASGRPPAASRIAGCSAGPRRSSGASPGSAGRRGCRPGWWPRGRACRPPGAARGGGPSRSGRCWCAATAPGRRVSPADVGRDLQGDEPVGQVALAGEVDAAEGPAASSPQSRKPRKSEPTRGKAVTASASRSARVRVGAVERAEELGLPAGTRERAEHEARGPPELSRPLASVISIGGRGPLHPIGAIARIASSSEAASAAGQVRAARRTAARRRPVAALRDRSDGDTRPAWDPRRPADAGGIPRRPSRARVRGPRTAPGRAPGSAPGSGGRPSCQRYSRSTRTSSQRIASRSGWSGGGTKSASSAGPSRARAAS